MARKRLAAAAEDEDELPRGVSWNKQKQRWMVQYSDAQGVKRREFYDSLRTAKATAKARRASVKRLRLEGARPAGSAITLIEAMREYLKESKATKISWRNDVRHARRWGEAFGHLRLDELTAAHIQQWRQEQMATGYARPRKEGEKVQREFRPASLNRPLAFLKRLYNATIEAGAYDGRNPCEAVSMLSENNARLRFLELEEEQALQLHLRPDVWRIVALAIDTGLRRAELFSLRREHVDLRRRQINIPRTKNGEPRHVDLTARALGHVRQLLAEHESEWVFPAAKGDGPATFDSIRHRWEKAVDAAKLGDFHWHDLRHTFASRLVMAGADLVTVKELLGHKTLAMVARYAHLSDGHRKSAIERMSEKFTAK